MKEEGSEVEGQLIDYDYCEKEEEGVRVVELMKTKFHLMVT